jgi:hypothetical protein
MPSDSIRADDPARLDVPSPPADPIEMPARPFALGATAVTGIALCALVGAVTNAVNGLVSPRYFITVLRWDGVEDIWRAAIAQGIFEGVLFGLFFSLIFTTGTGIITEVSCPWPFALRHLVGIAGGACVFWALGGLIAMLLATISPEFYRAAFFGVPNDFAAMIAYAFVGGSIWGVEFGAFVCVILGLVILRANWRREMRLAEADRP